MTDRKKLKVLILVLFFGLQLSEAQVGVNILNPHNTAALHVQSPPGVFKGLLTPSMTTSDRMNITSGTVTPADGLIVYDVSHRMHYYYHASAGKWVSMSPLVLSTPVFGANNYPTGTITTPISSVSTSFSMGINTQSPVQALHVVGNSTISGNAEVGGNHSVSGAGNFSGALNVSGAINVSGFSSNAMVPTGAIIMWSGTLIPAGWAICDGAMHGGIPTPDLRGRFIVGMNSTQSAQNTSGQFIAVGASGLTPSNAPADGSTVNYGAIGNTGGENGHTLSLAEMPSHTHNVSASVTNNSVFGFNGPGNTWIGDGTSYSGDQQTPGVNISETAKGNNQVHENRPPYYVLAYIIKLP
jgi:microcystin-dependent protein